MVEFASWEQLNGAVLGQYHLQQLLEQHQWGPIFLATDSSRQTYSVRFLGTPGSLEQSELLPENRLIYLGRFQQAASQLARLHHARILSMSSRTASAVTSPGVGARPIRRASAARDSSFRPHSSRFAR